MDKRKRTVRNEPQINFKGKRNQNKLEISDNRVKTQTDICQVQRRVSSGTVIKISGDEIRKLKSENKKINKKQEKLFSQ